MGLAQRWELQRHDFDQATHIIREVNQTKIIGRRDTDIVCPSTAVSRRHCQIEFRDNVFYLSDLQSLNGTFLNGTKVNPQQPRELRNGDVIGLGMRSDEEGKGEGGEYFVFTFRKQVQNAVALKPTSAAALIDLTNTSESESQEERTEPSEPAARQLPETRGTSSEESEEPGRVTPPISKTQAKEIGLDRCEKQTKERKKNQRQESRNVKVVKAEAESDSSWESRADESAEPEVRQPSSSEVLDSSSDDSFNYSEEEDQLELASKYPRRQLKEARRKAEKRNSQLRQLEEERERKRALEMARVAECHNQRKKPLLSGGQCDHDLSLQNDQRMDNRRQQSSSLSPDERHSKGAKRDNEEDRRNRNLRTIGLNGGSRRPTPVSHSEDSEDRRKALEKSQEEAKTLARKRQAVVRLERVDVRGLSQSPLKPSSEPSSSAKWQQNTKERSARSEACPKKRTRQPTDSDEDKSLSGVNKKQRPREPRQNQLPTRTTPQSPPAPSSSTKSAGAQSVIRTALWTDSKLDTAKEKIQNKRSAPRSIQLLDTAPAMKARRGQKASESIWSRPGGVDNFVMPQAVPNLTRKEKLMAIALKGAPSKATENREMAKRPTAPSNAKLTTRNRQDILFDSLADPWPTSFASNPGPSHSQQTQHLPHHKTVTASDAHLPALSASVEILRMSPKPTTQSGTTVLSTARVVELPAPREMPLPHILNEMNKKKNRRPAVAPAPLVPETQVKVRPATFGHSGVYDAAPSASKGCSTISKLGEDRVYRDILLHWKPTWLQSDGGRGSPPVHGDAELITCLPHYRDFQVYFDTFYPLMLHELWASISQDYQREARRNSHHVNRDLGMCDFQVGITLIQDAEQCPLTTAVSKTKQTDTFWHIVHVHCSAPKRGAFNRDLDFGKFSYDVKTAVGVERREVFFFVRPGSETYDEVRDGGKGFRYSLQIVTHLAQRGAIVQEHTARVEKLAYVFPKIRDLHCLSQLPSVPLSSLILNPAFPDPADVFDPNRSPSAADLVRAVNMMLNPIQRGVVHHIASRVLGTRDPDMFLLHGPPGTGKTRTIVGLVLQLLRGSRRSVGRVLVCTPSNTALDELIRRFATDGEGLKLVRLGQACSPDVRRYSLEELVKVRCSQLSHSEMISEAVSSFSREIEALERELETRGRELDAAILEAKLAAIMSLKQKRQQHLADLNKVQKSRRNVVDARRQVLGSAQVVFSTLNSCNGSVRKELLALDKKSEPFSCCIIDEATQTTEVESLSPLVSLRCTKLVLVGDPRQLPATILSSEAEKRSLGQSLFSRLSSFFESRRTELLKSPVMFLTQQYRMHPSILRWPNLRFYENKLQTHNSVLTDPRRRLLIRPFVFLNIKGQESKATSQISNVGEVALVREILTILSKLRKQSENHVGLSIGIISPYNDQKAKLRELLKQFGESEGSDGEGLADSIEIDTVDSFQGREKDIVLLSCVRTEDMGFLKSPERLNVALTRAKMALIIIGDAECLNKNEMWKSLMDDAATNGAFSHIPADYRDKGAEYLSKQLEQRLVLSPFKK